MKLSRWFAVMAVLLVSTPPSAYAQRTTKHHAKPVAHRKAKTGKVATKPASAKDTSVKVWVNTKSGVYHMPRQRWYGATQQGQYMAETEARKAGYTHTQNGQ